MAKNKVLRVVPKKDIPKHAKIMSSIWALRKKSNGTYRAILNTLGYDKIDGNHYESIILSPTVTNDATIMIIMVLMIIFKWSEQLVDVKGVFLYGNSKDVEEIYMEVSEGFETFYGAYVLLLLFANNLWTETRGNGILEKTCEGFD
jgi:hypothetical protein